MIELDKIRIFYYAALEGSMLKAANILGIKQPTVSKHISSLEESYKARLFTRKRTGLERTDAGELLYQAAIKTMKVLEDASFQISKVAPSTSNTLRLITTNGFSCIWLVQRLEKFIALNPNLEIKIYTTDDPFDFINSAMDVAILPKVNDMENVTHRKLTSSSFRLYASKEYINKWGMPKSLAELEKHRVLNFYQDKVGHRGDCDWYMKLNGNRLKPAMTISNGFGLIEAARCGLGITGAVADLVAAVQPDLVEISFDESRAEGDLFFITRTDQLESEAVKQLYKCLSA